MLTTTEYVQMQLKVQIRTLQINLRELTSKKGAVSFQADFRAFHSVGGRREILREPGSGNVVRSAARARELFEEKSNDFATRAEKIARNELPFDPPIGLAARDYLIAKAKNGGRASGSLAIEAAALKRFRRESDNAQLSRITSNWLDEYIDQRKQTPGARTGALCSASTIRKELMALSGMFEFAMKQDLIRVNPVKKLAFLPSVQRTQGQSSWLRGDEPDRLLDAAAMLDAETREARRVVAEYHAAKERGESVAAPAQEVFATARRFAWCEAVVATYLYTGGRLMEVLGLTVDDIDFAARRVRFESNKHRKLKKRHHRRRVEIWRPLRDTLEHCIAERGVTAGLLFESECGGMMRSFKKALTRCFERAGLASPGRVLTTHSLRHTYATRMLCTLVKSEKGRWAERSADNVRRKLGHRTSDLVERVYGHETDGERRTKALSFERSRKLPAKRLRMEEAALVAC